MKTERGIDTPVVLTMPARSSSFEHSVNEMYDQVARRAYELFEQRGSLHGNHHNDWLRAESEMFQPVPIAIQDLDNTFNIQAEVPGFSAKQLDVRVEPTRLLIRGSAEKETTQTRGKTIYSDSQSKELFRIVNLPEDVNPKQATASLDGGILHLMLPKSAESKPTRLEVKTAA